MRTPPQFVDLQIPGAPGAAPAHRIEYRLIDATDQDAPLLVFLHEGLGSLGLWRDFPDRVCSQFGCRGLVYSRYGYGLSTPRPADEHWSPDYLHHHAERVLPELFAALNIDTRTEPPVLFGHSDGGTIALLYAAAHPDQVAGIVVAAPHIFVEDITLHGIRQAREAYLTTDLRKRLSLYHTDVDSAFYAWNDVWLSNDFRDFNIEAELASIQCPVIAVQGVDDEYGTAAQIDGIGEHVEHAIVRHLQACGHSPHKDQPEAVIDALAEVIANRANP